MLEHYERQVFHHIPMTSAYGKYSDKHGFTRREIVYPALPDHILRAAFMLTWQAGAIFGREQNIRDANHAIDILSAVYPAMRIKRPTAHQAEKLECLTMLVDQINAAGDFTSKHQYGALKAILAAQKTGDRAHTAVAGMNLYSWLDEEPHRKGKTS